LVVDKLKNKTREYMKSIKPHLSPELRAQITPHSRKDSKYAFAGVFFLILSVFLTYNLWPKASSTSNNTQAAQITQTNLAVDLNTSNTQAVLGAETSSDATTQTQNTTAPGQFTQYVVKAGDTLFNISQKYSIKWDLIAQVNNLQEPYVLHAGQNLKIPQATTSKVPGKVYTVGLNETLSSIAQKYNITTDDIIAVNPNLQKSDLVTAGQIIKLP
jgi:LysM repeat protein